MKELKIALASDHAGFELKNKIISYLKSKFYNVIDLGTNSTDPVDYPDYADKLTEIMLEDESIVGILICGMGTGMAMAANRKTWIRAALCTNSLLAEKARSHNNANILVLGSIFTEEQLAKEILEKFLSSDFEGGRHLQRLDKIN